MNDYRGLYFDSGSELKFYEGGAHFKYSELCKHLDTLLKILPKSRHGIQSSFDKTENYKRNNQSRNNGKELVQYLTQKMNEFTKDRHDHLGKISDINTRNNNYSKGKLNDNHSQDIILMKDYSDIYTQENDGDHQRNNSGIKITQGQSKEFQPKQQKTRNQMNKTENYQRQELSQSHSQTQPYNQGYVQSKGMINCYSFNNNNNYTINNNNNDINTSSLYLSHNNNNNINKTQAIKIQNKKSLYHLIKLQKKNNDNTKVTNNNKSSVDHHHTNTNEISSLSDLNSSIQEDNKKQGDNSNNIIVKPKINISFVNNINALSIPFESRSRNVQNLSQNNPLIKMNTTVKQNKIEFDNETLSKYLKHAAGLKGTSKNNGHSHNKHINTNNTNSSINTNYYSNATNPFFSLKHPRPKINMNSLHQTNMINANKITMSSLSKDKYNEKQKTGNLNDLTPNTQAALQQYNISEKYSLLQRKINQMKVKTRNDLAKLSNDFENLISQTKKKSFSKTKSNINNNEYYTQERGKQQMTNYNNFITTTTNNNIKPDRNINNTTTTMINKPRMNTLKTNASQLSSKSYIDKNYNSNLNVNVSKCSNSRNKYK